MTAKSMRAIGIAVALAAGTAFCAIAFVRRLGDRAVFVTANLTPKAVEFNADVKGRGSATLAERGELSADGMCRLGPYGFVVVDLQK